MAGLLLVPVLGFVIGLVLGLLGGGGSILTVPALVYVIGQPPQVAISASLVIVGANSMLGALFYRSNGLLNWRVAFLFGGIGMVTAYFAARLSNLFAETLLLIMFAVLMLVVGLLMIFRNNMGQDSTAQQTEPTLTIILASGAVVGALTGLLGVGGGFLIVPALVMLVGLPMRQAVGTSLVIIAMNSVAGVIGHLDHLSVDLSLVVLLVGGGLVGTFVGSRLTRYIQPQQLRRIFAIFIIGLAVVLLYDNLLNGG